MDVIGFLQEYDIEHEVGGKNTGKNWVGVNCPFCGDSKYHGGFNLRTGGWNCWKCGRSKKRSTRTAIKMLAQSGWSEVYNIMEKYFVGFGVFVPTEEGPKLPFELPGNAELTRTTKAYLSGRNYDPEQLVEKYQIRCGGYNGDFSYRVIIPVIYHGIIISYQSRDTTNSQLIRYKDCRIDTALIYHKNLLYNLDNCKMNWCVIMEGVFDVWRGGDNCCCPFGTGYTQSQVVLLSDLYDIVFVWFDPGAKAQQKAQELCNDLEALGTKAFMVQVPSTKDPSDTEELIVRDYMQAIQVKANELI